MTFARKYTAWLFMGAAATVYTAVFFIARGQLASVHPDVLGIAAMCDLVITVPLLYYLLRVRPGHSSWFATVAIFLAGARAVGFLLPAAQRAHLPGVRWLGVPLELWVIAAVVQRLRRVPFSADPVMRIREAAGALFPSEWLAELVAGEILVLYYALFTWRSRPASAQGARSFSVAEASGYGMFTSFMLIALFFEGLPMHLLLQRWSHTAAWISAAAGVYGLVWIVGLRRSLRLQPILIDASTLMLRIGFLWRVDFTREQIAACRPVTSGKVPGRKEAGYLPLVIINEPQWLIELAQPAIAHGLFGRRKSVTRIGVAVDDAEGFGEALGCVR
jgi:hypothetical protein